MRRIVFATRNAGKLKEFGEMVAPMGMEAVRLTDVAPKAQDVEETGMSFLENAVLKAAAAYRETGLPSLADDSGICVHALDNGPGIHSARFSSGGDEANNDLLLKMLSGMPDEERGAHYHCALALVAPRELLSVDAPTRDWPQLPPGTVLVEVAGTVEGRIAHSRSSGTGGFGYDPLFFVPSLGCTFAEVSADVKHAISHRGKAFQALARILSDFTIPTSVASG